MNNYAKGKKPIFNIKDDIASKVIINLPKDEASKISITNLFDKI